MSFRECFSDQIVKTMLCHLMMRSEKKKIMTRSTALIRLQNPEQHYIRKWLEKAHQCFVKNKFSIGPSLSKKTPNIVLWEWIFVALGKAECSHAIKPCPIWALKRKWTVCPHNYKINYHPYNNRTTQHVPKQPKSNHSSLHVFYTFCRFTLRINAMDIRQCHCVQRAVSQTSQCQTRFCPGTWYQWKGG